MTAALIIAGCPRHTAYENFCPQCMTADDVTNQSLHPLGRCNHRCPSLEHHRSPSDVQRGTFGKSGILLYYPDGTTSADPLPEDEAGDP